MPAWTEEHGQGKGQTATAVQNWPSPRVGNPSHSQFMPFIRQTFIMCLLFPEVLTCIWYSAKHFTFIQRIVTELLLYAKHCSNLWEHTV